jgi:hypothetical protein
MVITARFAGRCAGCGHSFVAGAAIEWVRGGGARHRTAQECEAARAVEAMRPTVTSGSHAAIAAFLNAARERGLRFPKARFLAPDGRSELRLSLAGGRSTAPGSVQVVVGERWLGRVEPTGQVVGRGLESATAVLETLARIAADPAHAAQEYGALMARCSFCDHQLTDDGSVEVGYGPKCAQHWGLPHHALGTRTLTEVVE